MRSCSPSMPSAATWAVASASTPSPVARSTTWSTPWTARPMAVPYLPFRQAGRSRSTPRAWPGRARRRPGRARRPAPRSGRRRPRRRRDVAAGRVRASASRGQPRGRQRARQPGGGDQGSHGPHRQASRSVTAGGGARRRGTGRLRWRGVGAGGATSCTPASSATSSGAVTQPSQELQPVSGVTPTCRSTRWRDTTEVVTGTGAGHVQQADALVLVHLLVDGAGGVEPGLLEALAEAERLALGAEGDLHAPPSPAGRAVEAAHDGDRELQALGAMDGQDPHRLIAGAAPAVTPGRRRPPPAPLPPRRPRARTRPPDP